MTDRTLLELLSDIDDELIEEAAHPELVVGKNKKWTHVLTSRRLGTLAACMVVAIGLVFAVPYMNGGTKSASEADDMSAAIQDALKAEMNAQASSRIEIPESLADAIESAQENLADDDVNPSAVSSATATKSVEATSTRAPLVDSVQDDVSKVSSEIKTATTSPSYTVSPTDTMTTPITTSPSGSTTTSPNTTPVYPYNVCEVGNLNFSYLDGGLYHVAVNDDSDLTDLVIPDTLDGEPVTEIFTAFWSFAYGQPNLQTVTVPASVKEFGTVGALNKSVIIICPEGSAADAFFTAKGYTVQYTQP